MLCQLPRSADPAWLSASIPFADAGIYRLSDEMALVQSLDFFTPVVDDPTTFGRIAAANALSDIYAVGGRPLTALALAAFPTCALGPDVLAAVLKGGAEKVLEAGATIVGGHTVEDEEPKYGLAVTGLVDPRWMITAVGCRPGDRLVLTKPLGTGILATALKGEVIAETDMEEAIVGMCTLNRDAARVMTEIGASACTDITGFGLLGHALELAEASGVCLALNGSSLPSYPRVRETAAMGLVPAGSYANRDHYLPRVEQGGRLPPDLLDLLADPQTSGGLLIAVPETRCEELRRRLRQAGCGDFLIGRAEEGPPGTLRVD